MDVYNYTSLSEGAAYKDRKLTDLIVLHRCTVSDTPAGLVAAFKDTRKYQAGWYTGGKVPYHFFITAAGRVAQLVPLAYAVPGAAGYNPRAIQIAWERDTRKFPLKPIQRDAAIWLCASLQEAFNSRLRVVGHTEYTASSADPDKVCPGNATSLKRLRMDIASGTDDIVALDPYAFLRERGFAIRFGEK